MTKYYTKVKNAFNKRKDSLTSDLIFFLLICPAVLFTAWVVVVLILDFFY